MQLPWRVSIKSCRYHVCRWPGTISGPCSALLEPDPNSKTDPTLNPVKARLCWDRRGILADPISGTAVLESGPTEILPPVGAISKHPARLCRPGRQARRPEPSGKPGFLSYESGCGRETDSPLEGDGFEPSVPGTKEPVFVAGSELRDQTGTAKKGCFLCGTDGSNPSPSSGKSVANLTSGAVEGKLGHLHPRNIDPQLADQGSAT